MLAKCYYCGPVEIEIPADASFVEQRVSEQKAMAWHYGTASHHAMMDLARELDRYDNE